MEKKDAWEKFCEEYNQNEEERLRETVNKLKSELGKGGFVFENITADEYRANLYSKKCGSLADELIERGITPVKHGNWIYNTDDFTPAKRSGGKVELRTEYIDSASCRYMER